MKKILRLDLLLLFIVIFGVIRVIFLVITDNEEAAKPDEVLLVSDVTALKGDVYIWKDGDKMNAVKGMELMAGDSVITGKNGLISIRLPDGSTVRISELTACYLKRIKPEKPEIDIRTGQLRMERTRWPWQLNGPKGSVKTGRNNIQEDDVTSLGMVMRVANRVSIAVYEGYATWKTDGHTVEIPSGKAAILRRTDVIPVTIDLPVAPTLLEPTSGRAFTSGMVRAGIRVEWKSEPPAAFYRLEIRRIDDSTAYSTRYERAVEPGITLRNLAIGSYMLRVTSSDDSGLESDWSNHTLINVAGRIFDIPNESGTVPKLSFRSSKYGSQHILGAKVSGLDPEKFVVLIYELDGQWNLSNWESEFRLPLEKDGYFESAVKSAAKVALAVVPKEAANLPTQVPYGSFPPADKRFVLTGIFRLN